jgi:hypothetical protein
MQKWLQPGITQTAAAAIESNEYRVDGGASIEIGKVSADSLQSQARDTGVNSELPDFAMNLFQ